MNTNELANNSEEPQAGYVFIAAIFSIVLEFIYSYGAYLYFGAGCTGTGSACNRILGCTIDFPGALVLVFCTFLVLSVTHWITLARCKTRRCVVVVLALYAILIFLTGLVWILPDPRFIGIPCN